MSSIEIPSIPPTMIIAVGLPSLAVAQATQADITPLSKWRSDELYSNGISTEELLDADVVDSSGEDVGEIESGLFGSGGELVSVIVEVGGFLDIGDTHVAVPWDRVDAAAWEDEGIHDPFYRG